MKKVIIFMNLLLALIIVGCGGGGGGEDVDTVINISAITGVSTPVVGATPVTTITETDQYTGTVSWSPSDATFGYKVYTATITLTAKSGYTLTGVSEDFFTVTGTTDTNPADSGVVTAIFPIADWETYSIGDTGPAGGLIFYINPNAATDGWKYLECAPVSTEFTGKVWGGQGTAVTGADGKTIGTGKQNTIDIVTQFGDTEPADNKADYAAKLCNDLVSGDYDDWFLPSKDELNLMYLNLAYNDLDNFVNDYPYYWSSSEDLGNTDAFMQYFGNGTPYNSNKNSPALRVRAIRAF